LKLKISYLIPVYNCQNTIERCLRSIYSDKYLITVILINDNSNDKTMRIVNSLKNNLPYRLIIINNKINMGISESLNIGIDLSINEDVAYILRLDGDDFNVRGRTDFQVDFMEKNKNIILSSSNAYFLKNNKLITSFLANYKSKFEDYFKPFISLICSLNMHPTFIFRIEPFNKYNLRYGYLPEKFLNQCDFAPIKSGVEDLLIVNTILFIYGRDSIVKLTDKKLIFYNLNENGLTLKNTRDHNNSIDKIILANFILYNSKIPSVLNLYEVFKISQKISRKNYKNNIVFNLFNTLIGSLIIGLRYYYFLIPFSFILLIISPRVFVQTFRFYK